MGTLQDLQRWQRYLLGGIVAVLVISALVVWSLIGQMRAASQSVSYEHAERVIDADGVEIAVFARSANTRGYLLSGDPLFLENRKAAKVELVTRINNLRQRETNSSATIDLIEQLNVRLDAASNKAFQMYATSEERAREIWEAESRPVQDQLARQVGELVSVERAEFATARAHAQEAASRAATLLAVLLGGVGVLLLLAFYGYARVTRTLLSRQKAEQEQATFRLLEQVPVGIFVLAAGGKPYYANTHAKKLLGRGVVPSTTDRLAETYDLFEAGTARPYPADRMPIVRALAGDTTECTDMEIHKGDEVVPLHIVGAPVHDSSGELLYAVAGFQDVRELQRVAMRDALTGLANRAASSQIFARERAVSARAKRPFSIALIDLDRFKSVNDTHGHAAGDEVLKRCAASLIGSLRRSDAVGRWGGEELIVLLPNTEATGGKQAIDKALDDVRELSFVGKTGTAFTVTFSAGVVTVGASESIDEAVARADALLYEAKAAGRNRVHVARPSGPIDT